MIPMPTTRSFITSLISSLPKPPLISNDNENNTSTTLHNGNPLKALNEADNETTRSLLLTLHVLYPNELLPALDLLDRELVTRLIPRVPNPPQPQSNTTAFPNQDAPNRHQGEKAGVYYVRSAQQHQQQTNPHSRRYRDPLASSTHYEVRTTAWSCSCPAFAFAAFPSQATTMSLHRSSVTDDTDKRLDGGGVQGNAADGLGAEEMRGNDNGEWMVGGLSLGNGVPVCKHLLACALAERADMFAGFVKVEEVSVEELAGWGAGWGG